MKRSVVISSIVTLVAGAAVAVAATPASAVTVVAVQDPAGLAVSAADSLIANRAPALMLGSNESTIRTGVHAGGNGLQYVSYERAYKGVPVVGGDFVIGTNAAGAVLFNSVAQTRALGELSTTPKVTKAGAEATAKAQLKTVNQVESTRLVVYALGEFSNLAWETIVNGTGASGYSRLSVYSDAQSGKVLGTQEHVLNGTGSSGYSGTVTIATTSSGGTFSMIDPVTTNLRCQNSTGNVTFTGPDDVWGNGNATNRETGCVDALFAAQTEKTMLSTWLGRNGMNGSGGAWPIRVGLNDLNAFYDGTQVQIGHNQAGQWISSIDVIAHEMGHGIDDFTPGGISGNGTQEFVADVFGTATEWFANESAAFDPPDFEIGEEINLVGSGPIRIMYNPSLVGDPNCYSSSIPGTEVHAAAGPGDHWFYLLSQGNNPAGGPASPICAGGPASVTGLGIQTATRIMYNAMLMKTTGASYLRYRTWTLTAAKNLTPGNCAAFNTVRDAWNAVSVPAQAADPTCTGPTALALANPGNQTGTVGVAASLSLSATGGTAPYTFSASGLPAGLSINASSGVISGTPTTAATSSVTATVTDSVSASASQTFSWTINPPGSCSSPGQKLGNPGFETGSAPWTATAGVIGAFAGQTPHGGTRFAWLDGYGTTHTDTLSQSVALPAGCTTYNFSFWLHIDSSETTTTTAFDTLSVQVLNSGGTVLATLTTFSNLNKAAGYTLRSFSLSAFAGQTVTLRFTGREDISLQTSFVVDDTAVNVS